MKRSVRKAILDDYNNLCELFDEIDALHRDNLPHIFQKPSGPAREQDYYAGLISDEDAALLVAEAGEKLVGFAHAIVGIILLYMFLSLGVTLLWIVLL